MPTVKCFVELPFSGNLHNVAAAYCRDFASQTNRVYEGHKVKIKQISGAKCLAELEILLTAPVPATLSKSYNSLN